MPASRSRTERWRNCLWQIYERSGAIEISLARPDGAEHPGNDLIWRVKILGLSETEIVVGQPAAFGRTIPIEPGTQLIGAMSVGLVLCSKKAKKAYASDTGARVVFSIATIAFQVFFLAALAGAHLPGILAGLPMAGEASEPVDVSSAEASAIVVLLLLMIPFALARKERPEWFGGAAALVVFGISIACAALAYFTTSGDAYAVPALNGEFGLGAMAFASSGIVFGFALCPYLDQSITNTVVGMVACRVDRTYPIG